MLYMLEKEKKVDQVHAHDLSYGPNILPQLIPHHFSLTTMASVRNFLIEYTQKEGWWSLKKIQIKMLTCTLRMNPKKRSITNLSVKICHHNNQGVYDSGIEKYLHTLGTSDFKFSIGTDGSGSQRPRKLDRILDCEILRVDGLWYLLNLHQWQCTPWQQGEQTSKRCVPAAPHKNLSNTIMPNLNPLQESYNTLTLMNMP